MNTLTKIKRLLFASVVLLACGFIFTYAKGKLIHSYTASGESNEKGLAFMKSQGATTASNSAIENQGSSSGAAAAGHALTGKTIKNEQALNLADLVIVGRIIDLGERDLGGPGQFYYGDVKVEVVQTIKGRIYKTVTLSLKVQTDPEEQFEEPPTIGNRYILFLKKLNPKVLRANKIIEATEENLTKISALARSTGKKNQ